MAAGWAGEFRTMFPEARLDEPLARYTTFRIGGPADAFLELKTSKQLGDVLRFCREKGAPLTPLGFGSNLLVRDGGIRGVVVRLRGDFETVSFPGGLRARAGAGARVPQFVTLCAERGLTGPEPLVGIPGTIGGALVMNAGTPEGEIGPLVVEAEVFDPKTLEPRVLPASELRFTYRHSSLQNLVVTGALLQLKQGDKASIMTRVQRLQQRRQQTQPIHTFNVGSTFKNPSGEYAAVLIERAGLKGRGVGGVRVSRMHANFLENFGNAKAADVLQLIEEIRSAVKSQSGVELELEVKVVGDA
jgi:UDP-N-acetylmuramate dehydrogenase